ncbi:unnamed protein product [Eruca vesicaria subsp. sativa]|uniref:F-box associated beta-propeller type 3 domain-containing protein n=1 Tax=Eruca vesicaria subsp. sativa TaxID=29727 RepID=A0ABC8KJE4_ERUVS|nr:unnamed protein product [Eruca vesicaria subsp. sativa]
MGGYILQNLGGFMLYVYWRKPCILNPVPRQFVTLPFRKSNHMVVPPGGEKNRCSNSNGLLSLPSKGGISIGGVIYYLALVDRDRFVVVSFDIRSKVFNMIHVPNLLEDAPEDTPDLTLLEHGGKATLCDPTNLRDKGVLALWNPEDVGSKKRSCKSLVLQPSQLPLVDIITFRVKGTTQTGNVS